MNIEYVGPTFHEPPLNAPLAGGHTVGEAEAAAIFVGWIENGFPEEVRVTGLSSGILRMKASDLVEAAVQMLTVPLPMPEHLATKVREYVSAVPLAESSVAVEDEPVTWTAAIFDLKTALAYRQEHTAIEQLEDADDD